MDGREGLEGWSREEIALEEADILLGEPGVLGDGFDPFGNHVDAEFKTAEADGANDGLAGAGALDAADQAHVQLDLIGLKVGEEIEAGMGGAKVVDGQPDAEGSIFLKQASEVSGVFDDQGFRDLENEALEGQACLPGGVEGGEDRLRIGFKALGQEVEVEGAVDFEASGESDCRSARRLIELVQPEGGDLVEDLPGGFVPGTANQSLPGDDFARDGINNGLKCEAKRGVGDDTQVGAHGAPAEWERDGMARLGCGRSARVGRNSRQY